MEEEYCPIRREDGKCGDGGECDRQWCWEKMHYGYSPVGLKNKMTEWESHRRGDNRWKESECDILK